MMSAILDVRDLEKTFGSVVAARDISVSVPPQQTVGIIGSNGAGKTTFVNMITGHLRPTKGSIKFERAAGAVRRDLRHDREDPLQPLVNVAVGRGPGRQQDVLLDGELRHQPAVLRHVANALPDAAVRGHRQQLRAAEADRAGRRNRTHDGAQERGLARAVASDQAAHLALVEIERGAADDRDRADRDVEVGDLKHGARPRPVWCRK